MTIAFSNVQEPTWNADFITYLILVDPVKNVYTQMMGIFTM